MMDGPSTFYTVRQIAEALGAWKRQVMRRAARERWSYSEEPHPGRPRRLYRLSDLPEDIQAALLLAESHTQATEGEILPTPDTTPLHREAAAQAEADAKPAFTYDAEMLWQWARTRTQKLRDQGAFRAGVIYRVVRLVESGQSFTEASQLVAQTDGVSAGTIRNWYYGVNGNPGARDFAPQDRAAALIPGYAGRQARTEIPPEAWDWFIGYHLTRRQPTMAESYRRVSETAKANGWGQLPSQKAVKRRLNGI